MRHDYHCLCFQQAKGSQVEQYQDKWNVRSFLTKISEDLTQNYPFDAVVSSCINPFVTPQGFMRIHASAIRHRCRDTGASRSLGRVLSDGDRLSHGRYYLIVQLVCGNLLVI